MPTIVSHSVAALAVGKAVAQPDMPLKFWLLTAGCAMLPDIDVISFSFNIRYDAMIGHRGITHSFSFAAVLSVLVVLLFFREVSSFTFNWWALIFYFFFVTATHALLDALTNGGLGVAFFSPFSNHRYFFPVRSIRVSPISIETFFQTRGIAVLWSEFKWIWIPSGALVFLATIVRRLNSS